MPGLLSQPVVVATGGTVEHYIVVLTIVKEMLNGWRVAALSGLVFVWRLPDIIQAVAVLVK